MERRDSDRKVGGITGMLYQQRTFFFWVDKHRTVNLIPVPTAAWQWGCECGFS